MLGNGPSAGFHLSEAWPALLVVVMPLMAAAISERWFESRPERTYIRDKLARGPLPLLALVIFLIASAKVSAIWERELGCLARVPIKMHK